MTVEDEYDNFIFTSFTEEELAEIDLMMKDDSHTTIGGPRIPIQIEGSSTVETANTTSTTYTKDMRFIDTLTPFQRFRSRSLSVTDLVAPLWCEVQFYYGLTQRRGAPIDSRPLKFVTDTGKTIVVEQKIAKRNDQILKKGTHVHTKLEKEIHKYKIYIPTDTEEEEWATRLVNTMTRLDVLRNSGRCRELFVWGFINNNVVLGCIDEIVREPQMSSAVKSKSRNTKIAMPADQTTLSAYFNVRSRRSSSPQARPSHSTMSPGQFSFQLIDNKTRKSDTIPSHADTLSSRIQLMLYWRLLTDLVSDTEQFDFDTLWARLEINPQRHFSITFQHELMMLMLKNGLGMGCTDINCLQDLVQQFRENVKKLEIADKIDHSLCLVYRSRERKRKRSLKAYNATTETSSNNEETSLSKPVEKRQDIIIDLTEMSEPQVIAAEHHIAEEADPELQWALKESLHQYRSEQCAANGDAKGQASNGVNDGEQPMQQNIGQQVLSMAQPSITNERIIGKKKFNYNPQLLDEHVTLVLDWWHGKRPPKGVDISETQRCNTCEYCDGCEWREQKAKEFASVQASPTEN